MKKTNMNKQQNKHNKQQNKHTQIGSLATSLPLSISSSIFVRCDEDRLDVMKVLITVKNKERERERERERKRDEKSLRKQT